MILSYYALWYIFTRATGIIFLRHEYKHENHSHIAATSLTKLMIPVIGDIGWIFGLCIWILLFMDDAATWILSYKNPKHKNSDRVDDDWT
jgi:hypothetical protein